MTDEELFRQFVLAAFHNLMMCPPIRFVNGWMDGGEFCLKPDLCWTQAIKLGKEMLTTYKAGTKELDIR